MRSLEMFEEKTREFLQHKERLGQLENERKAVLVLIEEIEGRKKATFMLSGSYSRGHGRNYLRDRSFVFPDLGSK